MSDTPDLSAIVSLIMENPTLLSQIQELARGASRGDDEKSADSEEQTLPEPEPIANLPEPPVPNAALSRREKRTRLLSGLKPYLSDERKRTVDTMLTFADMLEAVRGK